MPGTNIQRSGLLFVDSFDHLTTGQYQMKWTINNGQTATGRTNNGLRIGGGFGGAAITLGGNYGELAAGLAYKTDVSFTNNPIILRGIVPGFWLTVALLHVGDGRLCVRLGGWGNNTSPISIFSMSVGTWYFLELTAALTVVSPGGGNDSVSYAARVNNTTIISGSFNGLTANYAEAFTSVDFQGPGGGDTCLIDDVYITDASVGLLGDTVWGVLRPNGEGFYQGFTPDSGTVHYDRIDDPTPDTTTYLASSTPGDRESEEYENMVATGPIVGVHMNQILKKSATGTSTAKMVLYDGVNPDWIDPDIFLPSDVSYYDYTYGFALNPLVAGVWTEAAVNGLQLACKRVT